MAIIQVHLRKIIVKDVLLDGGSLVNIIAKDLKRTLEPAIPRPTPLTLMMAN
jgi:hypothetical protein